MSKISKVGMVGLVASSLLLFSSIFYPWWAMSLTAPQYPEGLYIWVYPNKMTGQLDIINNLNHYIGMQEFSEKTFPELTYLPYVIGIMAFLTLLIGVLRNRKLLMGWLVIIFVGGGLGIYDIYRWLHKFGTELDPKAPIDIPPFVPPIYGHNKLANFTTYSFFSYGALLAGIAIMIMILVLWKGKQK